MSPHPQSIGPYRVDAVLGRGGMGVVYRAFHEGLGRAVALKVLDSDADADGDGMASSRFRREARCTLDLVHPNLVRVFDYGQSAGMHYLAMELITGKSLLELIAGEAPFAPARVLAILRDVLGALECLHGAGVVHRDLKPSNVMIDDAGRARVLDLGLARAREQTSYTADGTMVGSPRYLPPEMIVVGEADARSDLYQVGLIVHEMLTGTPAFADEHIPHLLDQIVNVDAPRPPRLPGPEGARLTRFLERTLPKLRENRFQSVAEAMACLDDLPDPRPQPAQRAPQGTAPPPRAARTRRLLVAVALLVGTLGAILTWTLARPAVPVAASAVPVDASPVQSPAPGPRGRALVLELTAALKRVARPEFSAQLSVAYSTRRGDSLEATWTRRCAELMSAADLVALARAFRDDPSCLADPAVTPEERADLAWQIGELDDLAAGLKFRFGQEFGLPVQDLDQPAFRTVPAPPADAERWAAILFAPASGAEASAYSQVQRPGPALFVKQRGSILKYAAGEGRHSWRSAPIPVPGPIPAAAYLGYRLTGGGPGEQLAIRIESGTPALARLAAQLRGPGGDRSSEGFVPIDPRLCAGPTVTVMVVYRERGILLMPAGFVLDRLTLHLRR